MTTPQLDALCEDAATDILVLSEYRVPKAGDLISQRLTQRGWRYRVGGDYPHGQKGVVIFSRIPMEIRPELAPGSEHLRQWIAPAFVPSLSLGIIGTYVVYPDGPQKFGIWKSLHAAARVHRTSNLLIAGDFNSCMAEDSDSGVGYTEHMLAKMQSLATDLWHCVPKSRKPRDQITWEGPNGKGNRLDYAFGTDSVRGALKHASHRHDLRLKKLSDHSGVLVEIFTEELRARPANSVDSSARPLLADVQSINGSLSSTPPEMPSDTQPAERALWQFDLEAGRVDPRPKREPAPHQREALAKLNKWVQDPKSQTKGGILVLPTGGGKTFTAIRFLTTELLSKDYKVLWLAHTHHLLDQAAVSFGSTASAFADEAANIAEPKRELQLRVVSGTIGHCKVHEITSKDDVVICTLPTAARAFHQNHFALNEFLNTAGDRLAVVFDEAHHAPAPTYARLIEVLRARSPKMVLLGLTATPTYSDQRRSGWLKRLFPQEIIHQVLTSKLMADKILARPRFEHIETRFAATFTEREYAKWVSSYSDLPDRVIDQLANSRERNDFIARTYQANQQRYGKTIIFADRWIQCEYLCEALRKLGIRADAVYSHSTIDNSGSDARNRRTADDNAATIHRFRSGDLDVLVNVRMLTEGTDVPNVQSVFLTRQTTSRVLLTQMIGRALRGPAFGGTDEAFVVSFVDDWTVPVSWADPVGRLDDGGTEDSAADRRPRIPIQHLSIELVRRLAREMTSDRGMMVAPFLSYLPVGWYQVEYDAQVAGSDDLEQVRQLLLVLDVERERYEQLISALTKKMPVGAQEVLVRHDAAIDDVAEIIDQWIDKYFHGESGSEHFRTSLFQIGRHIAQLGTRPVFHSFDVRNEHDLDKLMARVIESRQSLVETRQSLRAEYDRVDRYWRAIYPQFELFERHANFCAQRLLAHTDGPAPALKKPTQRVSAPAITEPTEAIKQAVLTRDRRTCLCCGSDRQLQIDHIAPAYLGGPNDMENLQVLCKTCNQHKGINDWNFRRHSSHLTAAQPFNLLSPPKPIRHRDMSYWESHLRRVIGSFYRCAAVQTVTIRQRGAEAGVWDVLLYPGNKASWFKASYRRMLAAQIADLRGEERLFGPLEIRLFDGV